MALTIKEELVLVWNSLMGTEVNEGWRKIGILNTKSMIIMAAVCYPSGNESILISFTDIQFKKLTKLPEGHGFKVTYEKFEGDSKTWVAITRNSCGVRDLFLLMIIDIIEYLKKIKDEIRYQNLLGRIKAWQYFMKPGKDGLTLEEELGLVGELLVFNKLLDLGLSIEVILDSWLGPEGGLQDFEIGIGAIEVKSTLAVLDFPAKIQSIEQLDDSQKKPLFVAGCKFTISEQGFTLPEMIKILEDSLVKDLRLLQMIEFKLIHTGYHHTHAERYTRRFFNTDLTLWLVDEFFPRLIFSNIPEGVHSVNYSIDLESIDSENYNLKSALIMLEGV